MTRSSNSSSKETKHVKEGGKTINWEGALDEGIANRLVANWKAWQKGNKIDLCRKWVTGLKLTEVVDGRRCV